MRLSYSLIGLSLLFSAVGCSTPADTTPTVFAVTGKVTLPSGSPAHGAEITLIPKEKDGTTVGVDASAILSKDGSFTMKSMGKDGVARGYYSVVINPKVLPASMASEKQFGLSHIPKSYWSAESTDLTVEISGDKQGWEIKLK